MCARARWFSSRVCVCVCVCRVGFKCLMCNTIWISIEALNAKVLLWLLSMFANQSTTYEEWQGDTISIVEDIDHLCYLCLPQSYMDLF